MSYRPAIALALAQESDGTWGKAILSVPRPRADGFGGVGTVPAVRRLLEYGWDRESPPLIRARRVLFRLLAEDDDPTQLYELAAGTRGDPDLIHAARAMTRKGAAAALAQAGYEGDPRLRGAAQRILGRVDDYLASPLAEKPWVRVGNRQVLSPDARPPSLDMLTMLAHMPLFRSEHHTQVDRLFTHLSRPLPRQESFQLAGRHVVAQPQLVLGDPLPSRSVADADLPFALMWLELMARLQFLRRHEGWMELYERMLDACNGEGWWQPSRTTGRVASAHPAVWPAFPLAPDSDDPGHAAEVTFRLGLIARFLGRPIEIA
jgi:hypothetical protein